MRIVELTALSNGAHRNQTTGGSIALPDGWAVIPEGMELPNFPFGEVTAKKVSGVMTVTAWVAGELPEVEEIEEQPDEVEQLRADVDYIAIMTGVEL